MTGLREGEQFTREGNDIDLDAGTIRLSQTKNGHCRFVQLTSHALTALRMLHAQSIGSERVFSISTTVPGLGSRPAMKYGNVPRSGRSNTCRRIRLDHWGSCQPPRSAASVSASAGPQDPRS